MNRKNEDLIAKFQELLRCGKDYSVDSMYKEAGDKVYLSSKRAKDIINTHYRSLITEDMVQFVSSLNCSFHDKIKHFSVEFEVCEREARLLIGYVIKISDD